MLFRLFPPPLEFLMQEWYMHLKIKQKIWFFGGALLSISVVIFMIVMFSPKKEKPSSHILNNTKVNGESFTFFDIGANTVLTEALREALSRKLGSETVAERSTIDLSMNYAEFLQQYAGELYRLNLELNGTAGARIEHNVKILTYRYPPKEGITFDYVRLIFSNYTQKPLYFIIKAAQEGSAILKVLADKYGEPKIHNWPNHQGMSYHWKKGRDLLILSQTVSRIGHPEFAIHIYFVDNISEMLLTEKREALKREQERKQIDREAF
jgi:hypothetical protein